MFQIDLIESETSTKEDVQFNKITDIFSKVGGFFSIINTIFAAFSAISFGMFYDKVATQIKRTSDRDSKLELKSIADKMKDRLSYVNLYQLFDKVNDCQNSQKEAQNRLQVENEELRERNEALETRVEKIEREMQEMRRLMQKE